MATTQAQADVMARTATRFEQVSESLDTTLRRLMGELEALRTQWQGHGGRSFEQVKQAWAHDQEQLHGSLRTTATAIRQSAGQYQSTDVSSATRFSTSAPPVTLPL